MWEIKVRKKDNSDSQCRDKQGMRRLTVLTGWLLSVAAFVTGGVSVFSISGKYNLEKQAVSYVAERNTISAAREIMGETDTLQARFLQQVEYDGYIYSYNDDILTFLFIGISREGAELSEEDMCNAQVKALYLVVLDPHEEAVKLIPIRCNTMTTVDIYDEQGGYAGTVTAQIGVRHGFDRDGRASCGYQVKAVQALFYGLPINGYLAADMDVVSEVIALIDGIDVELPGERASEDRSKGQINLLAEFISKGLRWLKEESVSAVKLYNEMSNRIITDITTDEVAYLITTAGGYCFDIEGIIMIPGIGTNEGSTEVEAYHDGFYVDGEAFYRLVLDIFYEPVG